jgi:hypothetical protein
MYQKPRVALRKVSAMTVSPWARGNQNEPACHEPLVAAAANRPFALLTYCGNQGSDPSL